METISLPCSQKLALKTHLESAVFIPHSYILSLSLYDSFKYYTLSRTVPFYGNHFITVFTNTGKKDLFRISHIQFTLLLQTVPLLKLVCQRELFLCTL